MASDTRERILQKALEMFAENGYRGTNLRDLAKELDLSKSAFYRHFSSKEEIWDELIVRIDGYYEKTVDFMDENEKMPETADELYRFVMKRVDFTLHDENMVLARKLLKTDQYHEQGASRKIAKNFLTGTRRLFVGIFRNMTEKGTLKNYDPEMLALCFMSPIVAMIHIYGNVSDEDYIIRQITDFLHFFIETYGV